MNLTHNFTNIKGIRRINNMFLKNLVVCVRNSWLLSFRAWLTRKFIWNLQFHLDLLIALVFCNCNNYKPTNEMHLHALHQQNREREREAGEAASGKGRNDTNLYIRKSFKMWTKFLCTLRMKIKPIQIWNLDACIECLEFRIGLSCSNKLVWYKA